MSLNSSQKGFTLIELMIAVLLGLVIVAAVTQVYLVAIRTASTQKAAAGILDANVYGLQQIERSLRMAGLGLGGRSRLGLPCSGILIANDLASLSHQACTDVAGSEKQPPDPSSGAIHSTPKTLAVSTMPLAQWTSPTTTGASPNTTSAGLPQLTIQYRAPVDMVDCEGNLALGPRKVTGSSASKDSSTQEDGSESQIDIDGQVIIERFFVAQNGDELELRCDAGRYVPEEIRIDNHPNAGAVITDNTTVRNMGDNGSLVVRGIDDFQVQLGVKTGNTITYQSIADFRGNPAVSSAADTNIVAVKMGILAKGLVAAPQGEVPASPTYTILGNDVTMQSGQSANMLRRVYESNTMLRNSRGED